MSRHVCHFSCGAASAVATKLILSEKSSDEVLIVNAFIKEEHPDNRRFLADCEKWFSHPVLVVRNESYGASVDEVWLRRKFIKQKNFAWCSQHLKREMLATVLSPGDVNVLGFTIEEIDRFDAHCDRYPAEHFRAPLIEHELGKEDCLAIVERAGIEIPMMYRLGYDNANCIGCPKGGQAYWQNIREDFPERFVQIKTIQESIGHGANFLRFRSGPRLGERMSLAELPAGRGDMSKEPSFSCSFFCMLAEQVIEVSDDQR
jgi:3'-phosphoadenosine 5'-phosphosulfate sulfotransferase (PAPS reductase)/FAD synthetase